MQITVLAIKIFFLKSVERHRVILPPKQIWKLIINGKAPRESLVYHSKTGSTTKGQCLVRHFTMEKVRRERSSIVVEMVSVVAESHNLWEAQYEHTGKQVVIDLVSTGRDKHHKKCNGAKINRLYCKRRVRIPQGRFQPPMGHHKS